ncbi:hypothetical protein ANN_21998 [Periplaneta americana]|uniref:Dynein heavy chain tail domain-containing protein n=1 Tax=Periplaneta americana TaxID=6978 RepID=A0ABQ8S6X4_PERAM|nr:hypothetical protein ANN_21998 [Periplaneta americana]
MFRNHIEYILYFYVVTDKNLARLNFQLQNKMLKNVCEILLMSQSTYIHSFLVLAEEIEEGLREAKSNIEFLQILHDPCSEMDRTVSPYDIPKIIPTLLQYIRVIWMNSPYYNTKKHVERVKETFTCSPKKSVRKASHELAIPATSVWRLLRRRLQLRPYRLQLLKALQPTDYSLHANFATAMLQHGDEDFLDLVVFSDKSTFHLNDCVNTHNVRIWGSANPHEMIAEMHTKSSNVPWELDNGSIFNHVDSFVQRCRDMIEICEAMIIFGRKDETKFIPEPRFGGTRGEEFEMIFKRVERTFESNLQAIWDVQTTILDVNAASWYNHILRCLFLYYRFRGQMKDIEVILENLMTSVFDQVANVEEGVYALQAFYHYAKRDALHTVYDRKTVDVYKMFDEEIRNIKEDMVKEKNTYPEGLSPFSGQALIISLKKRRLMKLMNILDEAQWMPACGKGDEVRFLYKNLIDAMDESIKNLYRKWNDTLDENISERLNKPLMLKSHNRAGLYESNFDRVILNVCREATTWQQLKFDVPTIIQHVYTKWEKLKFVYENVLTVAMDYNHVIEELSDEERVLFREWIKVCDRKIQPGVIKLKWNTDVSDMYVSECSAYIAELQDFVDDFKNYNLEIVRTCEAICDTPLVHVETGHTYELKELDAYLTQFRDDAFAKIIVHYEHIIECLVTVYEGFEEFIPRMGRQWGLYINKMDAVVEEAFKQCVRTSLGIMLEVLHGDGTTGPTQIIKVTAVLENKITLIDLESSITI